MSVTYATTETAGNLNVVVVGWNDISSSIISVVDDNNNTYALAGTSAGHGLSQAIYYAKNIALPNNTTPTVTVTFNQNAGFPDVRILEYSGLNTAAPLDNWNGSSGLSTLADSGTATTSTSDLILGAGTTGNGFTGAGTGFTLRVITSAFGDIVEDLDVAQSAGSYNATAPLNSGTWVVQVAGFSTTGVTFGSPPVISPTTPIVPVSGSDAGGTSVTITGTNFQPGAVVLFGAAPGGISGVNCAESGGTTITCSTPANVDGTTDVTVVNVDGQLSSATAAYTFQNVTPSITTVTPATGPTNGGAAITVTGDNFQVGAQITVDGLPAGDVVVQGPTTITGNTPGLPVGPADVKVKNPDGGNATKTGAFTYALGTGAINYVQRGGLATPSTTATVVGLIPNAQQAGNLNVVIIGWSDIAATVSTVVDTEGNTYVAALPVVNGNGVSQVIYYAKNIVGDTGTPNQVTVTFDQPAMAPDVRILEYSGLDITAPLDAATGNFGSGTLADSGACSTTAPVDVIVAGATVASGVTGAGAGFTLLDITQPNGDNSEHQITSSPGSCQATTPLTTGSWVMQVAAFKAAPAPVPDFTIGALPASQTVVAGSPAAYTITVTAVNGFNSAVALTCDSVTLPTGASCVFVPNSATPGATAATSDLTITTSAATPVGTSTVTITGTSGSLIHDATVGLTVNSVPPPADYTFTSSALAPASVAAGGTATSTITVAPLNGFSGTVNLSCSNITPVVTPAPTCAFVPTSIPNGSGTSALTVSTSASTPTGAYNLTVAGTGSVNHNTTVTLMVTATPVADFTIAASAATPASISAGGTATSTITITPVNGFNSDVNLTCAVTPVVTRPPTCVLSPTSVAGGAGSSALTVSTVAATTASVTPRTSGIIYAMVLPIGGLALLGAGFGSRSKKLWGLLMGCLLFGGLVSLVACGGSSSSSGGGHPGTPGGSYIITVTATSGSLTHTAPVTLTVN
ncbi:MAG: beta strand repeat-containing protein [Terriglobales bacterium]